MTHLRKVQLSDLSALTHNVLVSRHQRYAAPEFLVVRYSGAYRPGADGKGDATYIVATAEAARQAWHSKGTILDFSRLRYVWGDEMAWVTQIGWDRVISYQEPLAVVVSDRCKQALQSLLLGTYSTYCVESMSEAFEVCRAKWPLYQRHLREFKRSV